MDQIQALVAQMLTQWRLEIESSIKPPPSHGVGVDTMAKICAVRVAPGRVPWGKFLPGEGPDEAMQDPAWNLEVEAPLLSSGM